MQLPTMEYNCIFLLLFFETLIATHYLLPIETAPALQTLEFTPRFQINLRSLNNTVHASFVRTSARCTPFGSVGTVFFLISPSPAPEHTRRVQSKSRQAVDSLMSQPITNLKSQIDGKG